MLEDILHYEREMFFMLNGSDSPFFDRFMWLYTGKVVWLPLAVLILVILIYKKNWRESLLILLAIALVITLCDQFASSICKPLFTRFRPTHHPDFMNQVDVVFGYRGGRYGFISSHAANAFGFAIFISLLFRYTIFSWAMFLWAGLTAYSRVYLGVHFISDIIPGMLAGLLFGFLVYKLYLFARARIVDGAGEKPPQLLYSKPQKLLIVFGILFTVLNLLLFNVSLTAFLR
ncbi:undecaprenyl-diphosphatase [Parabacteroides sp. PF5-5]|uniref:phosphatase PAP2 family protein n=1 Tax=unclassified Parabacteroides TaxID=2649774 RepID=UPI002474EB54|nr:MULTISPECIES: phosphatase PAP2 family protein [unclassified Parabacteroides]MDH6303822.1 undecaprenyl-diphosphatase [Parabacteroides sp. PH5-39]MDH6314439.1 undecaprenyl-diphosphatase [Parabacteroides sp. PF5-13]MDH6318496.1 undecaprenyl-diphosphatase [Parabacteroides sp. PH5-13]MDH6322211.1 undecaprenyl-diphosphatase [Parabacteroides sp. PH5-8]MDH6325709.1 undecaprenyl-diphosphatase [Parabacteroides sp. PH5-41]